MIDCTFIVFMTSFFSFLFLGVSLIYLLCAWVRPIVCNET
jgi:hypothetical protein